MPPKRGYGLGSREAVERVIRGTRHAEKLLHSAPEMPSPVSGSTSPVVIQVTGLEITSPGIPSGDITNPYSDEESYFPENGYYPGVFVYRDELSIPDAYYWYSDGEVCRVWSINDEPLQIARRYIGFSIGNRNGSPVVVVDTHSTAVCPVLGSLKQVTANYTALWDDDILHLSAAAGSMTLTLPDPDGRDAGSDMFIVKRTDASGNTCTINPDGAVTIDGAASITIAQWDTRRIYHDGTNYFLG